MKELWNWFDERKSFTGLAAVVALKLNETNGWLAFDPLTAANLMQAAQGLLGIGIIHKLAKMQKKKA